ncbi:MAG TPA: N-acetyltransferase [Acidimicrobiales bacterium]
MLIRRERPTDIEAIDAVHGAAFPPPGAGAEPVEVGLVRALRADPGWVPSLSLVALAGGDPDQGGGRGDVAGVPGGASAGGGPGVGVPAPLGAGTVIGHVVCTVGAVEDTPVLGLGPLGVLPERQRSGVGAALMHAVLGAADALDHPMVVLLGHVGYYRRFGFVPATSLGVTPPDPSWGDHFQARPLDRWSPEIRGRFRYAAPFERL